MNPEKFFEAQLKELVQDCLYGQFHYRTWQRLNQSFGREKETMEVASLFFVGTAEAHLNSTRLHLYRILDNGSKVNSIYNLIKFAEINKEIFSNQSKLNRILEKHHKLLTTLNPIIENILKHRNKHFIHKSKEYLNLGYERLYKEYSGTYKDYREILEVIGEILNDILWLFKDGEFSFKFIDEDADFENLRYYLKKGINAAEKENKYLE